MLSNTNDYGLIEIYLKKNKIQIWYFHPVWVKTSQMEKFEPRE